MDLVTEYRRKLPHFQHIGASFFVTFRLNGSLPKEIVLALKNERDDNILNIKRLQLPPTEERIAIDNVNRQYYFKVDDALDRIATGPHHLQDPRIATSIIEKLKSFDGQYYHLDAYCVMSNHVHALLDFSIQLPPNFMDFKEEEYVQLHQVMKLIKGSTGYNANKLLGLNGKFWEEETFDRYIRNEKHRSIVIKYILNNPIKIGLCKFWEEYPFAWAR
jgi:putative transposase